MSCKLQAAQHDCKLFDPPARGTEGEREGRGANGEWHMAAEMGLMWAIAAHISYDSDVVASCKKLGRRARSRVGPRKADGGDTVDQRWRPEVGCS